MHKVNDKVWYIARGYLLIIECKIVEVDMQWRNKHPEGIIFYWLDEPIGHEVDDEEIYDTLEEAKFNLKELYEFHLENLDELPNVDEQLDSYRKRKINWIADTWEHLSEAQKEEEKEKWYKDLETKKYGEQWSNINNI